MKNKKYIIPVFGFLFLGLVSALIVIPGGFQLDKDEMASATNSQIGNYMQNTFGIVDYKLMENKIIVYYNITYVEPIRYFNNETNETETQYKVFTQPKPFIISKSLWNECTNETTQSACVNVLVNNEEPLEIYDEEINETRIITSTYYQAKQEQMRQYERAKEIRDNAISNELDYLFEAIE